MKIGLLTYHHSTNNGAMLQAYATVRALHELGHEVLLVDIRQTEDHHSGFIGLMANLVNIRRDHKIKKFKSRFYPPLSRRYYSVEELRNDPPQVDCLLVGSDQVWNPQISKEMAMAYFLDFGNENLKRISYASSFGLNQWPNNLAITSDVKRALHRFEALSVRETTGVNILNETFGENSTLVVDPTMLFCEYNELTGLIPERNEVVCYKLNRTSDFYGNIGMVKRMTGIPVRLLNNAYPVRGLRYTYPPSIEEWIQRIGGARYVITDSFHGTVFSILYKRDFVVITNNNGRDSRLHDLLKNLGLEERAFDSVKALQDNKRWMQPVDYSQVMLKLNVLRENSWSYIKRNIR